VVDDGARAAVLGEGRSLLAVGVVSCEGDFGPGDAVELVARDGTALGKGIASATPDELRDRPRGVEAVHRDRLVLYESAGSGAGAGGRVIAPSEADDTSAAYLASAPEV
jgi:glutamate 5-kinase